MPARLHVDPARLTADAVVVSEEDHRYLVRVLRLGVGDAVTLFDGRGAEADATIARLGPRAVELRVNARRVEAAPPGPQLTLIQALARGEKLDLVVQKATELGVGRIIPVTTQRAVPRLDTLRATSRRVRWQKIAREAARQSGRSDVPEVEPVTSLAVALDSSPRDALKLLLWEEARHVRLRELLPATPPTAIVIAVGPEGGFAAEEVAHARGAGFQPVGFGPRILRTETASLAALAVIGYALGDLG
jgi:16S rRNA (uracil1498-N3)-methyltransferase